MTPDTPNAAFLPDADELCRVMGVDPREVIMDVRDEARSARTGSATMDVYMTAERRWIIAAWLAERSEQS